MHDSKLLQELNLIARQPHLVILGNGTAIEGFAQGPYVAARVRFKRVTIRMEGTEPYHAPQTRAHQCIVNVRK